MLDNLIPINSYGTEMPAPPIISYAITTLETVATFIFKYRALGM